MALEISSTKQQQIIELANQFTELYWVANYANGHRLEQFQQLKSGKIKENKYRDINRDQLERFDLLRRDNNKPVYSLYLHEGQKLIWRRRTFKRFDGTPDLVIYLVGYQMQVMTNSGPRNYVVINYIHPDGSIALDNERSNLELMQFEQ